MNNWYLLAAIPVFGLLVIVHEFGHFITAKWAGIRVEEFAIGFPPRLFGFKRGETLYSINLLPIGGYVRMPGENGETTDEHGNYDPRSFAAKPASKRLIVLLAGVTMNVILAIVLLTAAEAIGQPDPSKIPPVIGPVTSGSPAAQAGIQPGDRILSVNGRSVAYFNDFRDAVNAVTDNTPTDTKTVPITVVVQHKDQSQPVTLTVQALAHPTAGQGHFGVQADPTGTPYKRVAIWQAPITAVQDIGTIVSLTVQGIGDIIQGKIPWNKSLQGPVGIVNTTGGVASETPIEGPYPIMFLTAFLSLNLAFVNALPIPALDGGRVLFVLIEMLRRGKRISPEREGLANLIGMGALLLLILIVTINDIGNWIH
jgi:regulator of sigma E protease